MEANLVYCVVMYTNFWYQRANQNRLRYWSKFWFVSSRRS